VSFFAQQLGTLRPEKRDRKLQNTEHMSTSVDSTYVKEINFSLGTY